MKVKSQFVARNERYSASFLHLASGRTGEMETNPYESPPESPPTPQPSRDYSGCLVWLLVAVILLLVIWCGVLPALFHS
jgi:hypothetical protein